MRSGETVATLARGDGSRGELVRLMTGSDQLTGRREDADRPAAPRADRSLERTGSRCGRAQRRSTSSSAPASSSVWPGSRATGRTSFSTRSAGGAADRASRPPPRAAATLGSARAARRRSGVAYVPRERRAGAVRLDVDPRELRDADARRGTRAWAAVRRRSTRAPLRAIHGAAGDHARPRRRLRSRRSAAATSRRSSSRAGSRPSRAILLLNDPTRGIDLGAKRDLYALLTGLAAEGLAVVMLSTEVDEHVELMDRVLVFREGESSPRSTARALPRACSSRLLRPGA